jgi:hypothetical protein
MLTYMPFMLSVIVLTCKPFMLSVIMLTHKPFMLSIIMLNVVARNGSIKFRYKSQA